MERDLVEYIVKSLVDNPDAVNIKVIEGEKSTILELRVAESDVGKVIGKKRQNRACDSDYSIRRSLVAVETRHSGDPGLNSACHHA